MRVDVLPLPQLKGSSFRGDSTRLHRASSRMSSPARPETLEVPAGSMVKATVELSTDSPKVQWRDGTKVTDKTDEMIHGDKGWQIDADGE